MGNQIIHRVIKSAIDIRTRNYFGKHSHLSVTHDASTRIHDLGLLLENVSNAEVYRHTIVSSISALQTFHMGIISEIVNYSYLYKKRASELFDFKINLKDVFDIFEHDSVTFGEIVAGMLSYSYLDTTIEALNSITGLNFYTEIPNAIEPFSFRNGSQIKLINYDILCENSCLYEAFRLRHILAHEAANNIKINNDFCQKLIFTIKDWIKCVEAVLLNKIFLDNSLTTYEMNVKTYEHIKFARNKLAKLIVLGRKAARKNGYCSWFNQNHLLWKHMVTNWYKSAYGNNGTIWSSVVGNDKVKTIDARSALLIEWLSWEYPEDDVMELIG